MAEHSSSLRRESLAQKLGQNPLYLRPVRIDEVPDMEVYFVSGNDPAKDTPDQPLVEM